MKFNMCSPHMKGNWFWCWIDRAVVVPKRYVEVYRDYYRDRTLFVAFPFNYPVCLAYRFNDRWCRYRFQESWIDRIVKARHDAGKYREGFEAGYAEAIDHHNIFEEVSNSEKLRRVYDSGHMAGNTWEQN